MILIPNKIIVLWKLGRELIAAGIQHNGMSLFDNKLEILLVNDLQAAQAQTVIDAHDGIDTVLLRRESAKTVAKAIPTWSGWTQAQFQTWCDNNLMSDAAVDASTLSAALKTNIKANNAFTRNAGKMLIALRDQVWADLPE
jgi:hypothetical protein